MRRERTNRRRELLIAVVGAWLLASSTHALSAPSDPAARGTLADETPRTAATPLYSIGANGTLHRIDPSNGASLSSVAITLAGETVVNGNSLAADPMCDSPLWAVLSLFGQVGRELVTIDDPETGVATSIGNTGEYFSGLAFDGFGKLYGITGTVGGAVLRRIDMMTAASESILALTNAGGHAIAFDTDDGLLYHATGGMLEKADLDLLTITPVPTSGFTWTNGRGMAYAGGGDFAFTVADVLNPSIGYFLNLTSSGVADSLGTTPSSKGLAFRCIVTASPGGERVQALRVWPNPFRGGLLHVIGGGSAPAPDLEIFDVAGRLVRSVPAATNEASSSAWLARWDGRDARGDPVPSGVYFVRMGKSAAGEAATITLLR